MHFRHVLAATVFAACSSGDTSTPSQREPLVIPLKVNPTVTRSTTLLMPAAKQAPRADQGAPWSLTASDGSGLELRRVEGHAVVEGPLAFTELHLYFHNPEARQREGTFAITLPQGAAVSRFAMETNGEIKEAEVVEKQLARRAYEDFLHRRQDPALLEKAAGNQFQARVFPIPANTDKHIIISFSQEVSPGHYALPLRGLAKTEKVDVTVSVRGADGGTVEQTLTELNWLPDRDVVVYATSLTSPAAVTTGELVAAKVPVKVQNAAEAPKAVTILVDTSASRALGFASQIEQIKQLVGELARTYGDALPVQIVAFDQTTEQIAEGTVGTIDFAKALLARDALGASDLGQALTWLGDHHPNARVIVVGDGVITAGANPDALAATAKALGGHGVDRIDMVLSGGIRDDHTAAVVARAGLAHTGAVLDLDRGVADVARRVGLAVATNVPISVEGASWVFPKTVEAAQAGDEVMVYAHKNPQAQEVGVTVGSSTAKLAPVPVNPAFLARAVAGAEIAEMDTKLGALTGDAAASLKKEIVAKSVANRVVSSQTSLLVLESDQDYDRFGIQRNSLADILVVGASGIELSHRVAKQTQKSQQQIAVPDTSTPKALAKKLEKAVRALDEGKMGKDRDDGEPGKLREELEAPQDQRMAGSAAPAQPVEMKPAADKNDVAEREVDGKEDRKADPSMAPPPPPPPPPPVESPRPSQAPSPSPTTRTANVPVGRRFEASNGAAAGEAGDSYGASVDDELPPKTAPLTGQLAAIESLVHSGNVKGALDKARAWHAKEPGDVLALIGLGDSLEASKDLGTAARVYGSIIDLYPARADFRRFAGERLERIAATTESNARKLAIDSYKRGVEERPDHLTGHRLLAYALLRDGQYAEAFAAILVGLDQKYPDGRFLGADRVLHEDAGMIGAAYLAHAKDKGSEIKAELAKRGSELATQPSTRFIMYWETDANDVDFHIRDARGGHAWYSSMHLPSGGDLYADITTGYGPECFTIPGTPKAGPYQLSINYYSQGPMGYGMGLLQVQKYDGKGGLSFEDRPYVIMVDHAFVDLGTYK